MHVQKTLFSVTIITEFEYNKFKWEMSCYFYKTQYHLL